MSFDYENRIISHANAHRQAKDRSNAPFVVSGCGLMVELRRFSDRLTPSGFRWHPLLGSLARTRAKNAQTVQVPVKQHYRNENLPDTMGCRQHPQHHSAPRH